MSSWQPSLPLPPLPPLPEWVRLSATDFGNGRTSPACAAGRESSRSRARSRARSSSVHTDTPCQSVGSGATKHADFFVSVIDDAEVTDDDDGIVERNNTRKPAATVRARSRSPSRPQQAARSSKTPSAAQPLDVRNERCWEGAFTFVRLYELILGRPAGPINCLAIVQRPQMYLNQLQREVITVICEELLHRMSGYGTEDRSVSEKTRLLIKSMISIRNIRAKFYHDDHVLTEAELRGLINHLRHQWIDTELEPQQMNLPMRKKTSI